MVSTPGGCAGHQPPVIHYLACKPQVLTPPERMSVLRFSLISYQRSYVEPSHWNILNKCKCKELGIDDTKEAPWTMSAFSMAYDYEVQTKVQVGSLKSQIKRSSSNL